jgi:tetratricopeptide (TPR) repeat protein
MAEKALEVSGAVKATSTDTWSSGQAAGMVFVCLLVGTAGGWLIRKSTARSENVRAAASLVPAPAANQPAPPANLGMETNLPSVPQSKEAADAQAAPILERLKAEPNNAGLLASVGNIYYDAKQYPSAIHYYERSLNAAPTDTSVRTDLGTAYWYTGDADRAIAEFNKSLTYDPVKADTLFNLGVVKWQGKKDGPGAVAAWQKLLETNPAYANKDAVLQMITQAR